MKEFFVIIVSVSIFLCSCGIDISSSNKDNTVVQGTTVSGQTIEFKEVNEQLKNDVNNASLYINRGKFFMKLNDLT